MKHWWFSGIVAAHVTEQQMVFRAECWLHQRSQQQVYELSMAGLAALISLTTVPTGSGGPRWVAGLGECVSVCVWRRSHSSQWHLSEPGWPTPIQRFLMSESIMWSTSAKDCWIPFLIGWPLGSFVMWPAARGSYHQVVAVVIGACTVRRAAKEEFRLYCRSWMLRLGGHVFVLLLKQHLLHSLTFFL